MVDDDFRKLSDIEYGVQIERTEQQVAEIIATGEEIILFVTVEVTDFPEFRELVAFHVALEGERVFDDEMFSRIMEVDASKYLGWSNQERLGQWELENLRRVGFRATECRVTIVGARRTATEQVVPVATAEDIVATTTADDHIAARSTVNRVVQEPAVEPVIPVAATNVENGLMGALLEIARLNTPLFESRSIDVFVDCRESNLPAGRRARIGSSHLRGQHHRHPGSR